MSSKKMSCLSLPCLIIVMGCLFALCSANAFGSIFVVPDNYATIQEAIDISAKGDTVIVRDGTYNLTEPIDFKGKAIVVTSENGATNCILDGQQKNRVVYFHGNEGHD